jgi:hypothetical protein
MSINSTGLSEWEGALVVKPATAWRMLGCSNTYGYALLNAGKLDSFRDGRSRKITVESIRRYITDRLAAESKSAGKRGRGRPRKIDAQLKAASQEVTP